MHIHEHLEIKSDVDLHLFDGASIAVRVHNIRSRSRHCQVRTALAPTSLELILTNSKLHSFCLTEHSTHNHRTEGPTARASDLLHSRAQRLLITNLVEGFKLGFVMILELLTCARVNRPGFGFTVGVAEASTQSAEMERCLPLTNRGDHRLHSVDTTLVILDQV